MRTCTWLVPSRLLLMSFALACNNIAIILFLKDQPRQVTVPVVAVTPNIRSKYPPSTNTSDKLSSHAPN